MPAGNVDTDLENDLLVRAEANDLGDLKVLRLGEAPYLIWLPWANDFAVTRSCSKKAAPCPPGRRRWPAL